MNIHFYFREYTDDEKQNILKLQDEKIITEFKNFFEDRNIKIEKIMKQENHEGATSLYNPLIWIFTSIGRFDVPRHGGMGILNNKVSREFWKFHDKLLKENNIIFE